MTFPSRKAFISTLRVNCLLTSEQLIHDPVITQVLDIPALTLQPSLSRFFNWLGPPAINQLQTANRTLLDGVHRMFQSDTFLIDPDSS